MWDNNKINEFIAKTKPFFEEAGFVISDMFPDKELLDAILLIKPISDNADFDKVYNKFEGEYLYDDIYTGFLPSGDVFNLVFEDVDKDDFDEFIKSLQYGEGKQGSLKTAYDNVDGYWDRVWDASPTDRFVIDFDNPDDVYSKVKPDEFSTREEVINKKLLNKIPLSPKYSSELKNEVLNYLLKMS